MKLSFSKVTETTNITTSPSLFGGFTLGTDGINDPTITVTDGASGAEIIPTATYDASALGLNGALLGGHLVDAPNGVTVVISCAGTVEVTTYYKQKGGFLDI